MKNEIFILIGLITFLTLMLIAGCKKEEYPNHFTDPRDGTTYSTTDIGDQTWFAENLNYKTYDSRLYDNNSVNGDIYGRLYKWNEAIIACPDGWHLPEDSEWKTLEMYLGMSEYEADKPSWRGTYEGEKLKSTSGWNENGNGTDIVGFKALPGGYGDDPSGNIFHSLGDFGMWWTATEADGPWVWIRVLAYPTGTILRNDTSTEALLSVRCLKD